MEATLENIKECMTKFDPDRIKERRAFSLSSINSDNSWVAEGEISENEESYEDPYARGRRYSFPLTPTRQKNLPHSNPFQVQVKDI